MTTKQIITKKVNAITGAQHIIRKVNALDYFDRCSPASFRRIAGARESITENVAEIVKGVARGNFQPDDVEEVISESDMDALHIQG